MQDILINTNLSAIGMRDLHRVYRRGRASSATRVSLLGDLPIDKPLEVGSSSVQKVFAEWRQLQKKAVIEGFLVEMEEVDSTKVEYSLPVTLSSFNDASPGLTAAAAQATQLDDVEWLIS